MATITNFQSALAAARLHRVALNPPPPPLRQPPLLPHDCIVWLYQLSSTNIEFTSGLRIFELSNHLGNVLATLTDRKLHRDFNLNDTADFYLPDTTSFHDYYPYGMEKPGRGSNPTGYRFGFNGVEADNTLMPGRTGYHTYFRQYDTRTARWFSVDPVVHPWQSPYNAMDGNPIYFADPGGANTIAREEDPDIFDTETAGTDPASVPTGGESFKFENTIGFDPLAGIKNNISNPSTVNPPMQDNSTAAQNSYSFENNMQAEGGGENAQGGGIQTENGDGYIEYEEAYWTYKLGGGEVDLFADLNKLDLSKISASDFPFGVGSSRSFNFAGTQFYTNPTQALVYGSITLHLLPGNKVVASSDVYDFDLKMQNYFKENSTLKRDFLTIIGNMYNGGGTPYYIHFKGSAIINP